MNFFDAGKSPGNTLARTDTAVREAQQLHAAGHYAGAMQIASRILERICVQRLDLTVLLAIRQHEESNGECLGQFRQSRVVRGESGVQFMIGPAPEAGDSLRFLRLIKVLQQLPAPGFMERLYARLVRLTRCCQRAAWPPEWKRRPLRTLNRAKYFLLRRIPAGAKYLDSIQLTVGAVFHEPEHAIADQLQQHGFFYDYNYSRRLLHCLDHPGSRCIRQQYLGSFHWPEQQAYERYIRRPGSRVLLTIHMGDFVGAFNRIAGVAGSSRETLTLRRERTGQERFLSDDARHQVLYHGEYSLLSVVAALRRGNHTLATLFDLKDDFGATTDVSFLGYPARFVKGPAQLAIMGRAPVIPFVTYEEDGINIIEMESAIDTALRPAETLEAASRRITQALVDLAERWIRERPAQWKYLPVLPAYLNLPQAHSTYPGVIAASGLKGLPT